ncbi:MAG: hypothetical protein ACLGRW_04100 [Acidobacteriota bacterium]
MRSKQDRGWKCGRNTEDGCQHSDPMPDFLRTSFHVYKSTASRAVVARAQETAAGNRPTKHIRFGGLRASFVKRGLCFCCQDSVFSGRMSQTPPEQQIEVQDDEMPGERNHPESLEDCYNPLCC